MIRAPEHDAALVQVVIDRIGDPVHCPILRILEVGNAAAALQEIGIDAAAALAQLPSAAAGTWKR